MSTIEVKAAAKECRETPEARDVSEEALYALAEAYCREHPEDDDDPLGAGNSIVLAAEGVFNGYRTLVAVHSGIVFLTQDGWDRGDEDSIDTGIRHKGGLRLLCRALGIELKEPK